MESSSSTFISITLSLFLLLFLTLPSTTTSLGEPKCHSQDKKALQEIKAALNDPYILSSWTPDLDCCHWHFVFCDDITGRVNALYISRGELSGQIPAAVTKLPYLQTLGFYKLSNLTGEIPSFLTELVHLKYLTLSWTNLSGPVPSFLSQLKNLTFLDLSFNDLSGTIPPSLGELRNLEALHLDRNKLTGAIPESFGKFTGNVPDIYLNHNMLTGTVPKSFGELNFSLAIDLSRNKLEGDVSFLFGKNKTVQVVNLSRNLFEFNLSKVEFPDKLVDLDLNRNKIFGSLPVGLAELELQFLNVSYNRLCGKIPTGGTGRLQDRFDSYSYFHNKCLCGDPLPACF